jgi:acetylornithine/N-succinyldiaminopimelate aminotransferase
MCAVGQFVVSAVGEATFLGHVRAMAKRLTEGLDDLAAKHGLGETRGRGLLVALDLGRDVAPAVVETALERGLLINAPRADTLRFMPALNVTAQEIGECLDVLDEVLAEV